MPSATHATSPITGPTNLFSFDGFLQGKGLTRTTGYRYRKQGLLATVNVFGRLYITRDEIEKFERRAIAGEFSRPGAQPTPPHLLKDAARGKKKAA